MSLGTSHVGTVREPHAAIRHPGYSAYLIRLASSNSSLPVRVAGAESQAEAVSIEAREDVQVDVEDLLARRLAVGQKEVDLFAFEPALVESRGDLLGAAEHVSARILR